MIHKVTIFIFVSITSTLYAMDPVALTLRQHQAPLTSMPADIVPQLLYTGAARTDVKSLLALQQTCKYYYHFFTASRRKECVETWYFNGEAINLETHLASVLIILKNLTDSSHYISKIDVPELYIMAGAHIDSLPRSIPIAPQLTRYLKMFIKKGAAINQQDPAGNTFLHYACMDRSLPAVELLLQHGADTAIKNNQGETPSELVPWSTSGSQNNITFRIDQLLAKTMTVEESIANPIQ